MEFGPDGAFATDLRNEEKAEAFLHGWGLERGKFLCCIPRYRITPYWTIHKERAFDPVKQKRNDEMKEHDHAQLRAAIVAVVKQTDLKVLICPEDRTQMALGKEILFDKLPDDVKDRVVWREDYWLTDEALSVYVRSAGLFGNEMHSPIMCIGNGIPAIVCRWAEQTSKGNMWKDIGLSEWLFDLDDEPQLAGIVPAVLAMAKDPAAAKAKVPTVPGSDGPVDNQREAIKEAQRIGFPVIIKAVAGGGGKGMRIVHNAAAFSKEFDSARSEAEKAFGNGSVYIEKYIEQPRHIEFQMLADEHGKVLHLGERDCSVQRRHQKLIEESPSPFLTPKLREEMGKVAVRLTESIGYHNAGTIEFLVDRNGN